MTFSLSDGSPALALAARNGTVELTNRISANDPMGLTLTMFLANPVSTILFDFANRSAVVPTVTLVTAYDRDNNKLNEFALNGDFPGSLFFLSGRGGNISKVIFDDPFQPTPFWSFGIAHLLLPQDAVPEPASWMLMLGGFGFVGSAMRARQRTAALAC